MDLYLITGKKIVNSLLAFAGLSLMLCSSCGDEKDIGPSNLQSKLLVIQAAPDVAQIDLYLNGIKQNSSPVSFPSTLGYFGVRSGEQQASIRIPITNFEILEFPVKIDPKVNYTLFFTGLSSSSTYKLETIFIADSADAMPSPGRAKLRFVNASPSSHTFEIFANNTLAFSKSPFKQVTEYVEFPAGTWNFRVNLTKSSTITNDSTVANIQRVVLQDGRLYTLYTSGIAGRLEVDALDVYVIAGTNTVN